MSDDIGIECLHMIEIISQIKRDTRRKRYWKQEINLSRTLNHNHKNIYHFKIIIMVIRLP